MLRLPRFGACILALGVAGVATTALADELGAADATERIDDPKLERRLGTRVALGAAPAGAPTPTFAGDIVIAEATPSEAQDSGQAKVPRLKLAYRWFTFAQIGPVGAASSGRHHRGRTTAVVDAPADRTTRRPSSGGDCGLAVGR